MTTLMETLVGYSTSAGRADGPLRLTSTIGGPATDLEIAAASRAVAVPEEVRALWRVSAGARLFQDAEYCQWGLELLGPGACVLRTVEERSRRPSDFRPGDVVLGAFLGDQDLLVVAPGEQEPRRRVMVATPLDEREEWFAVGPTLVAFLQAFLLAAGEKFWEVRQ